ncbi:MAG: MFS transporter [Pirellulales bacterium]|nr:MFS transporter [Pirellulales bacterium]
MTLEERDTTALAHTGRAAIRPTRVRWWIAGLTMLTAVALYLDRVCISEVLKHESVRSELALSAAETDFTLSAFFWTYALLQVPSGWLSDRYGARYVLAGYVLAWSLCTGLTGLAAGLVGLAVLRMGMGAAQAGAYPTAGALLSRWMPFHERASASALVAFGGRVGGAMAPYLTAVLIEACRGWRPVMVLYGLIGALTAFAFWLVVRERPDDHPSCNEAERAMVARHAGMGGDASVAASGRMHGSDRPAHHPTASILKTLLRLSGSLNMWLMCLLQFATNVGWVFLITKLADYLNNVKRVPNVTGGLMVSVVLVVGMLAMLLGGPLADRAVRWWGVRWGRALPLAGSRFLAALGYVGVLWFDDPWAETACFALVALATDLGVPACWAYMQDVGGKQVGMILGWGNMWGNLGAAVSPMLAGAVLRRWDANGDWNEAMWLMLAAFVVSGLASLGVDARACFDPGSRPSRHA